MTVPNAELRWPEGLDALRFLRDFWQRKPLLMRAALPDLRSPLDADELAGLACEPEVESRIVREHGPDGPWQVHHGPFDEPDFQTLPPSHWTLLVQDVDKHVPQVAALLASFDFLPEWRLDDIMISWAADQGSVGPHLDEYDVFLVQVEGRRRWRIETEQRIDRSILPDLDLRILQRFDPDRDWLLAPGDVLYLPPGVPHWGVAEGACMTWSVGLRAPAWRDLLSDWLQHLVDLHAEATRWSDGPLEVAPRTAAALPSDLASAVADRARDLISRGTDAELTRWLGCQLTELKPNLGLLPPETPWTTDQVRMLLRAEGELVRDGASRLLHTAGGDAAQQEGDLLFANGECHRLPAGRRGFLVALCRRPAIRAADIDPWLDDPTCSALLTRLFNAGHFSAPDAEDPSFD